MLVWGAGAGAGATTVTGVLLALVRVWAQLLVLLLWPVRVQVLVLVQGTHHGVGVLQVLALVLVLRVLWLAVTGCFCCWLSLSHPLPCRFGSVVFFNTRARDRERLLDKLKDYVTPPKGGQAAADAAVAGAAPDAGAAAPAERYRQDGELLSGRTVI